MLDYKVIGRRIAFYRKKQKYTQAKLAEKLGVSDAYISQIECGISKVSLERLSQLADILEIDINLFFADICKKHETYCCSEILELIKQWSPEQKEFLLKLVISADENLNNKENDSLALM